jgi:glutaminase
VSLCTIDGQRHAIGDVHVPFTLQSGCMPINYALALNELGPDIVHRYVGHEPSGESFAYIKLNPSNLPHNPLINSGAIAVASLIKVFCVVIASLVKDFFSVFIFCKLLF